MPMPESFALGPKSKIQKPKPGQESRSLSLSLSLSQTLKQMGIAAAVGVLVPFPFYYLLWSRPQSWVDLCGKGRDPSKVMAHVSHLLKVVQLVSLFSVSSLSWPPPLYFWPLLAFGQFLNFRSVPSCLYAIFMCVRVFVCEMGDWDVVRCTCQILVLGLT